MSSRGGERHIDRTDLVSSCQASCDALPSGAHSTVSGGPVNRFLSRNDKKKPNKTNCLHLSPPLPTYARRQQRMRTLRTYSEPHKPFEKKKVIHTQSRRAVVDSGPMTWWPSNANARAGRALAAASQGLRQQAPASSCASLPAPAPKPHRRQTVAAASLRAAPKSSRSRVRSPAAPRRGPAS